MSYICGLADNVAELQYTSWWDGSGMKFEMGGMDPTCHHPKLRPTNPCNFLTHHYFCTEKECIHTNHDPTFHSCASPINPTWFSSVQNESYTKVVKFSLVSLPQFLSHGSSKLRLRWECNSSYNKGDEKEQKVKQMQSMWFCIILCMRFDKTFENTQWRKAKQMQPMWLCLFSSRRFEETFENTQWRKAK